MKEIIQFLRGVHLEENEEENGSKKYEKTGQISIEEEQECEEHNFFDIILEGRRSFRAEDNFSIEEEQKLEEKPPFLYLRRSFSFRRRNFCFVIKIIPL